MVVDIDPLGMRRKGRAAERLLLDAVLEERSAAAAAARGAARALARRTRFAMAWHSTHTRE